MHPEVLAEEPGACPSCGMDLERSTPVAEDPEGAAELRDMTRRFAFSAALISYTAKISLAVMMAATLFGYLVRLGLILLAILLVKDAGWISLPALGATIIVTHLGLLVWELKYVAISLAHAGIKPARP